MFEELAHDNPGVSRHRRELLTTYNNLRLLWMEAKRPENVVACVQRIRTLLEGLLKENPTDEGLQVNLISMCTMLGEACEELGRDREALNAFEQAASRTRTLIDLGDGSPLKRKDLLAILSPLLKSYRKLGRSADVAKITEELRGLDAENPDLLSGAALPADVFAPGSSNSHHTPPAGIMP